MGNEEDNSVPSSLSDVRAAFRELWARSTHSVSLFIVWVAVGFFVAVALLDAFGNAVGMVASTSPVFTATPAPHAVAKDAKPVAPAAPSQQMVRHNCATARALLDLTRSR